MAHSFEYAVLTAVPNPRRGERVNVGIIVFRPDRIDVRFKQAEYKLRALTGENWRAQIESAEETLKGLYQPDLLAGDLVTEAKRAAPLFQPSGLGRMNVEDDADYERTVNQILTSLVTLPKKEKAVTRTRINTEITNAFRKADVLAKGGETIDDRKVVRDFIIDENEGIVAPFALKNGKIIVASTLDLRKSSAGLEHAALSSITLDKAKKRFSGGVRTIGVFAVDDNVRETFKSHIELLGDYADDLFDWLDNDSNKQFRQAVFNALQKSGNLL